MVEIYKSINIINHIHELKDKSHIIISIDIEKAFNKIEQAFIIKVLDRVGPEGTYLNIMKVICDKPTANFILRGKNLKKSN